MIRSRFPTNAHPWNAALRAGPQVVPKAVPNPWRLPVLKGGVDMQTHDLRHVRFVPANPTQIADGLLGFVQFEIGLFRVDGTQLRRSRESRLHLSFPTRVSANGTEYPLIRPTSQSARNEVETCLFRELQKLGAIP